MTDPAEMLDDNATEFVRKTASDLFGNPIDAGQMCLEPGQVAGWDSLNHLRLVTAIETEFSLRFSMREVRGITCLNDFVDLIRTSAASS